MMKISIAMATFNGEKFILEQLESFSKQTTKPDELIITDDCSTDNTLAIVDQFKKTAPFKIRVYLNKKKLGYTQNFNKAMQLCAYELILLSDQDDVWFATKVEHMLNLTRQYPNKDLFMVDAELTDINLKKSGLTKQGQIRGLGMSDVSFVMGCCVAVKKSYLNLVLPVPKGFSGHDSWIVNIADMLNLRYVDFNIQQCYRIHTNNTSTFSANSLVKTQQKKKVTFFKKVSMRLNSPKVFKSSVSSRYIFHKKCLLTQLVQLSKRQRYSQITESIIISLKKDIVTHEKRLDVISSKNRLTRIIKAFKLYFNGGYKAFSGFESFISDIFFIKTMQ